MSVHLSAVADGVVSSEHLVEALDSHTSYPAAHVVSWLSSDPVHVKLDAVACMLMMAVHAVRVELKCGAACVGVTVPKNPAFGLHPLGATYEPSLLVGHPTCAIVLT